MTDCFWCWLRTEERWTRESDFKGPPLPPLMPELAFRLCGVRYYATRNERDGSGNLLYRRAK